MKSIPNLISILRIILSLLLFFLPPFGLMFWTLYVVCGCTDMLDGYIARKTHSSSKLGSMLDSIADMVLMSVIVMVVLSTQFISTEIWIWMAGIALVRMASLWVVYWKHRTFAVLHTYANKATGGLLFCIPFLYHFVDFYVLEWTICIVVSLAAIEELIVHITSSTLQRGAKSLFIVRRD
ncbi:CDP-alcohol phosphatidyltransferase family protein [Paenibacillus caui]|uniref:CDP-alcohol phosphatidyltransferase family protein n=1 Tax=Paenibacillus caui TaxID=2873927 RepID=UPI001CA8CAF5|nr:CDP-alcohol phosphatidyltransferase family protein [Paenibacillus caui]